MEYIVSKSGRIMTHTPSLKAVQEEIDLMEKIRQEYLDDLERASICDGLFVCRPAGEWIEREKQRPDPVELWKTLWHEHEVSCLFADSNMGKSIYAVQIAEHVARRGMKVLYFDFELAAKQFQMRYSDPATGNAYRFSPNLLRVEFGDTKMPPTVAGMVERIEMAARETDSRILIIDNLTWICNNSEQGDAAGELMQALVTLKRSMGLSILCLAHTPKRAATSPLTQNSLAGSKRIANFMDSMFAIGRDMTCQPQGRYVKQIKVRSAECLYGDEHVIRYRLERDGEMLKFVENGYGREADLLLAGDDERSDRDRRIAEMARQGMSQRQIADEVGVSKSLVAKIMLKNGPGLSPDAA